MNFVDEVKKIFSSTLYGNYNREIDKVTGPAVRALMNNRGKENVTEKTPEKTDDEISL